ncbi:SNF2-related protein [Lewinella sp. LCG006]|uniref:SNF2-related protein n=1 Tax=Lewinella sp. LCG006 TaxID=3231911 RepID=UPI00345F1EF9
MPLTPYHAKYYAYELTKRSPSDSIQKLATTLVDAQVDLNPHQVEAALFAFRSPLSKGAILADEVGLGKTIEAGLVISQKWAERKRRILIISPSSLRKQWSQELADKFFIPSVILEAKAFNNEIKAGHLNPFEQDDQIVICSFHFARNKESYLRQTPWDLVVIDEAHKLRNVYKPTNKIGKAIKRALLDTPKILLTATPLQNSLLELYGLVSIIDDYAFGDLNSFKQQYARLDEAAFAELRERLKPLCKRTLRRDVLEYIKYTNRNAILQSFVPYEDEQRLYDLVSVYLQKPNLYALPASQRKLMTLILRKLLASSSYAISGTLQRLLQKLEVIKRQHSNADKDYLDDLETDYEAFDETEDEWYEEEDELLETVHIQYSPEELAEIDAEIRELQVVSQLATSIEQNAKGEALLTALKTGMQAMERQGANQKAIIFTESRRTQAYLQELLERNGYAGRIVQFNGNNDGQRAKQIYKDWLLQHQGTGKISGAKSADQRAALVDYFRKEGSIMIATEAAAEGINLQFCSLLVNYDLPWNPQRIEQRIGRCHRYGQRFDVVVINFLNEANAADRRVYQLLNEKFHLFDGVFGASDEVIGSIESGVDFEKRIADIYQNCRSEQEIQAAFDELQSLMDSHIQERMSVTKQQLLDHFDTEVHEKLRISLEKSRAYLNRYEKWLWQLTRFALQGQAIFNEEGAYAFSLTQAPFEDHKIPTGNYRIGKNIAEDYTYRIGHPLAQRIIQEYQQVELPPATIQFDYSGTPKRIAILESLVGQSGWMKVVNLRIDAFEEEDHVLVCACTETGQWLDEEQASRLLTLSGVVVQDLSAVPAQVLGDLDNRLHHYRKNIIQAHSERNAHFFDEEMGKLEHWAEDIKSSLELELRNLEQEIKTRKAEARKVLNLDEKIAAQRKIKALETKRNQQRRTLFQAQDKVDEQKEQLIDNIEQRMQHELILTELFTIQWNVI